MKKESIITGVLGLVVGIVLTGFAAGQAVNNSNSGMMRLMGMESSKIEQKGAIDHSTMSMADMNQELENLSGDDYDKAFVEMMIAHHEGAVDMAQLSSSRAKHNEVKQLSQAIISAQNKEIADMKQWQLDWGYGGDEMMNMMHGGR